MGKSKIDALVERLMQLTQQPELLLLIAVTIPLVLYFSRSPKYRWWVIALWAFFLPLAPVVNYKGDWLTPPFPFSTLVLHGRQAALFLLIAMLPAAMRFRGFNREIRIPPPLIGLFAMNMVYCVRYLPTPQLGIALTRLVTYLIVFYLLAMSMPRWVPDRREVYRYLSAASGAVLVFLFATLACYQLSPGSMAPSGRMAGLAGNPNHFGALCGYAMPAMLGLSLSPGIKIRTRYFWLGVAAFTFIILLWTGSRTSLGMCGLGVAVIFRAKLGRFMLAGIPMAVFVWVLSLVFTDAQSGAERMTSLSNTRMSVWTEFFGFWKQNLVLGNSDLGMRTIENSYLALAANTGFAGCIAIIVFLILTTKTCLQLVRMKPSDRESEILRDVALAGIAAAMGNSVFEATLLSSLSSSAFWIFLYFTLAGFVINSVAAEQYRNWYEAVQLQYRLGRGQIEGGMSSS